MKIVTDITSRAVSMQKRQWKVSTSNLNSLIKNISNLKGSITLLEFNHSLLDLKNLKTTLSSQKSAIEAKKNKKLEIVLSALLEKEGSKLNKSKHINYINNEISLLRNQISGWEHVLKKPSTGGSSSFFHNMADQIEKAESNIYFKTKERQEAVQNIAKAMLKGEL